MDNLRNLKPFMGQIPLGQTGNKLETIGWGDRFKVRIMGSHPEEGTLKPDEQLPWGYVIKPGSQGSGNKGSIGLCGGETVFGLWNEEPGEQGVCFIIGSLARSNSTVERSATEQAQFQSLGFKLPNIFIDGHNPAQGWNFKSGDTGTPAGQQSPFQPSIDNFTSARNALGS